MCRATYWAPLGFRHLSRAVNPSHCLTIGSNCWSLKSLVSLGVLEKIYLVTWNWGPLSASDRITKDAHMTTYFLLGQRKMRTWRGSASGPEINAQGRWQVYEFELDPYLVQPTRQVILITAIPGYFSSLPWVHDQVCLGRIRGKRYFPTGSRS